MWNISTEYESTIILAASPSEQLERGLALADSGFRPSGLSVAPHDEDSAPTATASLWIRPLIPEEAKDRLAKRQANAAVALLRLNRSRRVWPLLVHRPDPRVRSYLIHRLSLLDADPDRLLGRLGLETEVSIRRALILALGEFDERQLNAADRRRLAPHLLELYARDPDPGIHGAAFWLLRRWGHDDALDRVDRDGSLGGIERGRNWFINRQGQTFSILGAPGEVVVGSPPSEVGREEGPEGEVETQRHVRIDHDFAIMNRPVTVAEFLRFRKEFVYRSSYSPDPDRPINNIAWYDAAAYCNWLSEQEGIPPEQWCYLPNDRGDYAEGMSIVERLPRPDGLSPPHRGGVGIRLPRRGDDEPLLRRAAGPGYRIRLVREELAGAVVLPGRHGQAERLRPVRHDRQRRGMDAWTTMPTAPPPSQRPMRGVSPESPGSRTSLRGR